MKKLLLVFYFLLLSFFQIHAQHALRGYVFDEKEEPLAGAVLLLDDQQVVISSLDGYYDFKGIPQGVYLLQISFLGYETIEDTLNIIKDEVLNFHLVPQSHLTSEVVVTAFRAGHKTPVAYTNIQGDKLRTLSVNEDLPFLLQLSPSLVATSETGLSVGNTGFRIRGSDPTRINVTVNGVPLNDPESQAVFWANLPDFTASVKEVQIQRGVGTSSQGAAAFGATVNFSTTSDSFHPFAELTSSAGAYNTFKNSFRMGSGLLNDRFSFEARYSRLLSDGYIHNSFSDHESLYLSATLYLSDSFLKFNIIHGDQKTGISWWGVPLDSLKSNRRFNPAGIYTDLNGDIRYYKDQTDNYIQTHYQLFYSHALSRLTNLTAALHYTRGDGYYEQYREDQEFGSYGLLPVFIDNFEITHSDLIRQKWMGNNFYGMVLSMNSKLFPGFYFSGGGGWNRYDGDHFGKIIWARYATNMEKDHEWYFNKGIKTDFNLFAKFQYQHNKLNTFLDLQWRNILYDMSGIDDTMYDLTQSHDFGFFNPKIGVFYEIKSGQQSYLSIAISNREPTRTNFKDANLDPDATPMAERLFDIEAGYNFSSSSFSANVNLFYMYYKDQLIPTGEKSSAGYDIMTNVPVSYRTGTELQWIWRPFSSFRWDGNITLSRNVIQNYVETAVDYDEEWKEYERVSYPGNTQIAYSPSITGSSSVNYSLLKDFSIVLNSKYVGKQYFDNTSSSDRQLKAYLIHNLNLKYLLNSSWLRGVEFQFMVNNLMNKKYEINAYGGNWYEQGIEKTWAYYYPMAPRNIMGQIIIKF